MPENTDQNNSKYGHIIRSVLNLPKYTIVKKKNMTLLLSVRFQNYQLSHKKLVGQLSKNKVSTGNKPLPKYINESNLGVQSSRVLDSSADMSKK